MGPDMFQETPKFLCEAAEDAISAPVYMYLQ